MLGAAWHAMPCHLIDAPQVPRKLCCDSSWLDRVGKKPSLKADMAIYSYIVTVSGEYLSVAITLSNKMGLIIQSAFTNPVTASKWP